MDTQRIYELFRGDVEEGQRHFLREFVDVIARYYDDDHIRQKVQTYFAVCIGTYAMQRDDNITCTPNEFGDLLMGHLDRQIKWQEMIRLVNAAGGYESTDGRDELAIYLSVVANEFLTTLRHAYPA